MRIISIIVSVMFLLCSQRVYSQLPVACEQVSGIVNSYEAVVQIFPCLRAVRTANASGLQPGSRVLMIQMKGADINEIVDSTFGSVESLRSAGAAEYLEVQRIANDTVVFTTPWVHEYNVLGIVQLVRVQRYGDAQVIGTVYAKPWNGITGGVIAIDVERVLTLDANIDASGAGFRGGKVSLHKDTCGTAVWSAPYQNGAAGEKGEGIWLSSSVASAGKASAANAAGGGNGANAGGGGGGNGGTGGQGGDANSWCNPFKDAGGRGGQSMSNYVARQYFFMGGGGGGAHQNNNQGTSGSNGGGIVVIRAGLILANKGAILSRGASVMDTAAWKNGLAQQPGDGAGGAGAGGTIVVDANVITGQLVVDVRGGNGGNQGARYQSNGPGGGGAGGVVVLTKNHASVKLLIDGGIPGVHVSPETGNNVYKSPWGATVGDSGAIITPFQWRVFSRRTLEVSGRTTICPTDSTLLAATPGFLRYQWSSGETTSSITVKKAGLYTVYVTDSSGCSDQSAQIQVTVLPSWPQFSRPAIDFGVIEIGSVSRSTVWLKHMYEGSVTITSIQPPSGVRLVRPTSFPIDLARDSIEVELEIIGAVDATINDSLEIVVQQPCPGTRYLPVRATINAEHAYVIGGVVSEKAGTANVAIPLSFQHDSPTPEILGAYGLIHLRIDSRLYVPTGLTNGTIVSSTVDSATKMRQMVLDVDGINITRTPSECTRILGSTLLAPFETSPVIIDTVEWLQISRKPRITRRDGQLTVKGICYPGSRAIVFIDGPIMRVRPQPASEHIVLDVHERAGTLELVQLYDLHGRIVRTSTESVLDVQGLGTGLYLLVGTTTGGRWASPVRIQADEN
ncbi:MAG: hypothetical protein FJ211_01715 [Ignavibacteria bacterium]|nr:hypothetical protein [Ignavibacteria bacterium]